MATVGVRELKAHLSRYLKDVRAGETILVTDRGRPVARIMPVEIPEDLARLITEGRIRWSGERFRAPENPVKLPPGAPLTSDLIAEDRR